MDYIKMAAKLVSKAPFLLDETGQDDIDELSSLMKDAAVMLRETGDKLKKAEDFIRLVAVTFSEHAMANWSSQDVLANVADYFGITVSELDRRIDQEGW